MLQLCTHITQAGSAAYRCSLASLNDYKFSTLPAMVDYGFKLDGVQGVKNRGKLTVYADPVLQPITGGSVGYYSLQDATLNIKASLVGFSFASALSWHWLGLGVA